MNTTRYCRLLTVFVAVHCLSATFLPSVAEAQPIGFPPLDQFADANPADYVRPFSYPERWANGYLFFTTPDGISCATGGSTWCTGPLPGTAAPCASVSQDGPNTGWTIRTTREPCVSAADPILAPGQKLTNPASGVTCAVGADRLVACITGDNTHGFVLQPSGSRTF